jgi:hypothetical protein
MTVTLRWVGLVFAAGFLLALFIQDEAKVQVVTGVVTGFRSGELIAVANETTDPQGIQIALRGDTRIVGDQNQIKVGATATVKFRRVGERRPIADEVRLSMSR